MSTEISAIRSLLPAATPQQAASVDRKHTASVIEGGVRTAEKPPSMSLPAGEEKAVRAAADQIESYLRRVNTNLEFRVDQAAGRIVVSVRERSTGELIRQMPSEEALQVASRLDELVSSVLVDQES